MEMHLDMALQHLHCVTPTDPSGEDEPYLWVFFIVADGSTIRQRVGDPLHLTANIAVHSGSGRPGNLNEATATSGAPPPGIFIPESVGRHQSAIETIVLNLPLGPTPTTVFIPGRMIAICAALDEESVPRDAMETAFNAVKSHIQNRLNDFFNGLAMTDFAVALSDPNDPIGAASTLFNQRLDTVVSQISDEAQDIAEDAATDWVTDHVDWWNPATWAEGLAALADKEEAIGSHTFTAQEPVIIDHGLHDGLSADLRQPTDGLGGAWYVVSGYSNATVRFVPGGHRLTQLQEQTALVGGPEEHMLRVQRKCIDPGTVVEIQRTSHFQHWQLIVAYPFMHYTYALDGKDLTGDSGTVQLSKITSFPQFDETQFYLIGTRKENRTVKLSYQFLPVDGAPQLRRLVLSNDPADGNFEVMLTVDGLLPQRPPVPVLSEGIRIVGQTIDFAAGFLDRYIACVARSLKEKWVRVKAVIPDRWRTPEVAWNRYQEIVNELDDLQAHRILDAKRVSMIKQGVAGKLKLDLSDQHDD